MGTHIHANVALKFPFCNLEVTSQPEQKTHPFGVFVTSVALDGMFDFSFVWFVAMLVDC